ncbi:MAG: MFS transporter [Actinobacteria bacterium]|nr:MFS transporter [Actinomycetota bacterium]
MLTTYRRALALPGAWQFSATGFVARLPMAMDSLGIVLLISARTGSYAQAGVLAAAFTMAAAGGALLTSRSMDRLGQGRLLPPLVMANTALLLAFVTAVHFDAAFAIQLATVALAGATQPAIGSMVRARWANAAPDADRLRSGFALESVVDELVFTMGPLLTAFLAFQVGLATPLIVAACFGLVGGLLLALQRSTQPAPSGRRTAKVDADTTRRDRSALAQPGMIYVVIAAVGVGGVFGSYEVAVVAFAQEAGRSGASGLVLGLWALGSMLAGIVFGSRHWRRPLAQQLVILTGIMALVMVPAPFVHTIPMLTVTTFFAGMAVAPSLIAAFSLTERLVPAALLTEGLTWANSGLAIGFAAGTTLSGAIVDAHGTSWAFVLPIVSAATSFAVAALGQPILRRASIGRPQPLPAIAWVNDPMPGPTPGGIIDDPDRHEPKPEAS